MNAKLISMLPKGAILKLVQKRFSKNAGFNITHAKILIDYEKGNFNIEIKNDIQKAKREGVVSEYSDMSDILLNKVRQSVTAKQINVIDVYIDFENKAATAKVYYTTAANHFEMFEIEQLF